jgi:hypothetical protein
MQKFNGKRKSLEKNNGFSSDRMKTKNAPLHCLHKIRCRQDISRKTIARQLGTDVETVKKLENEYTDIPLSVLYAWQKTLDVPLCELLVETNVPLEPTNGAYTQMADIMKTAIKISRHSRHKPVMHMTHNFINQLLEIMPELHRVILQHGHERPLCLEDYDHEVDRCFLDDMLEDYVDCDDGGANDERNRKNE